MNLALALAPCQSTRFPALSKTTSKATAWSGNWAAIWSRKDENALL